MGSAVIASKNGFIFDLVWDKYHDKGREIIKSIIVVKLANLNDNMNGDNSNSNILIFHYF